MNNTSTTVACKVDDCIHYSNDYCSADKINVASQAGMLSHCSCSSETECSTFQSKSKSGSGSQQR